MSDNPQQLDTPDLVEAACTAPAAEQESSLLSRPIARYLLSAWLLYHLSAVVLYPASVPVPDGYLLYEVCETFFSRYMEGIHMIHGHRFFSPDPPDSGMLIEYEITQANGTDQVDTFRFPNRDIRPRLMYHRYFMLSERCQFAVTNDIVSDESIPEEDREAARALQEEWFRSYARSLLQLQGGDRIVLRRVYHNVLTPRAVLDGAPMGDLENARREELGAWTREELGLDP